MRQQWRIRVRGKQRKDVDRGLMVQAILELARQMECREQSEAASKVNNETGSEETSDRSDG